jgi:tetratricopeptide (TPR) repeat protein
MTMARLGRLLAALALIAFAPAGVLAQSATMRERVYERLSRAEAEADQKRYDEALAILRDLEKVGDLSPYELAQLHTAFGFVSFSRGDVAAAVEHYENVLEQPDLPPGLESGTLFTLGQLSFQLERYDDAVQRLTKWLTAAPSPGPDAYILLAQAYYGMERYADAVSPVEKAIELAQTTGRRVEENWYLLLRVLHYEQGDHANVVNVLETLVTRYPKKEYWLQLAAMYGQTSAERRQLGAYEAAREQGFLESEAENLRYAQLLLQANAPYRAGKALDRAIREARVTRNADNLRLLSQAWTLAKEDARAIEALTAAAEMSGDGELDARLAIAQFNVKNYDAAAKAAREALRKGVERSGEVEITLGMALYELERWDEARTAFRDAQDAPESRATAAQWVAYLDKEQARRAELGGVQ